MRSRKIRAILSCNFALMAMEHANRQKFWSCINCSHVGSTNGAPLLRRQYLDLVGQILVQPKALDRRFGSVAHCVRRLLPAGQPALSYIAHSERAEALHSTLKGSGGRWKRVLAVQ